MKRRDRLLARARTNPNGVRFSDLLWLVDALGFQFLRQEGSHRQYKHPKAPGAYLNLQPDRNGMAKLPQVRQVLAAVEALALDREEEKG